MLLQKDCVFCNDFKKRLLTSANGVVPKKFLGKKLIFGETENLLLTTDLFPIVDNAYFLIIPKNKHVLSFSNLEEKIDEEIQNLLERIRFFYGKNSKFIFFEHGEMAGSKSKINSVYHAHTHVILSRDDFLDKIAHWLKKNSIQFRRKLNVSENIVFEIKKEVGKNPYLFFSQNSEAIYILPQSITQNQSQFFRRLMVKFSLQGESFINWKKMNNNEKNTIKSRLEKLPLKMLIR